MSIMTADGRFYERQMEISLAVGDFVDQEFVQADIRKMGVNQKNVFDVRYSFILTPLPKSCTNNTCKYHIYLLCL